MNGLNVKAFIDLGNSTRELQKAIDQDDIKKQMVALVLMEQAIREARQTMMAQHGGLLN